MRIGSLFAGIGGFDLAARWMGWETAWFSEVDSYACRVLAKHWPGVPNHGDITKIRGTEVASVDMLVGGFPCQDISVAGRGAGLEGERSGLWREYARLIRECGPRWVVIENVAALISRGWPVVRRDLRAAGYRVSRPICMSAAFVGAPHLRRRLWIVAHAKHGRLPVGWRVEDAGSQIGDLARIHGDEHRRGDVQATPVVADPGGAGQPRPGEPLRSLRPTPNADREASDALTSRLASQWTTEPSVGRVADGVPDRMDRLHGLGNAIVPHCAYAIFHAIAQVEAG